MIHAKRNLTTLLVVSLFIAVISLSGAVSLAAVAPVVTAMPPVRDGMMTPVRVALDPSGNAFYVTDARAKAVLVYNVYGHLVKTIKTAAVPLGIAVSGSGDTLRLLVTQGKYIAVYDPNAADGAELQRIGVGIIGKANGVAVDGVDGSIYVADGGQHKVHVFDAAGTTLKTSIGSFSSATPAPNGTFNNPGNVAYEKANRRIAVTDTNNGRVQLFSTVDYSYVGKIGSGNLYDARLDFVSAQGAAFDYTNTGSLNRMYILDTWKGGIQVVDPVNPSTGTYLSLIGAGNVVAGDFPSGMQSGTGDNQFLLPSDVQYDPVYRRLFVVSADSSVKILGIDGGKSPSDNLPHYLKINPSPLNTNVSTYTISGTVKPGSDIKITTSTGATAGSVQYLGKAWSAVVSGLTLGDNVLTVQATDVAGAVKTESVKVVYTLNAPALAVTTPNGKVVSDLSTTLEGTVDAGCTVTIRNNTTQVETVATVTGTPVATWSGVSTLSNNAANSFTITARKAGSNDATATVTVISDTTPPILHISALPDGSYSSGTMTQDISGYVQDANPATVSVSVNGGTATVVPTPLPDASFTVPVSLQAGTNTITVQATDAGGKTSWINTRVINYDAALTRPRMTIDNGNPSDNTFTQNASVTISGTVNPPNATVTIVNIPSGGVAVPVTGVTNVSGSWNATVPLVAGQNTIVVTATSGASDASLKRTVTLDATAPELAITSPATAAVATKLPNMDITGTVSGGPDGYPAITATINSVPVTPPTVTNGAFTFNTGTSLVAGPNTISITATDSANNSTTVTRSVNYDTVAPSLALTSVNPGRSIGGTVEVLASVSVSDVDLEGRPVTFTVTPSGTTWTADLSTSDYNPATIQIKAIDAAGNASVITGLESARPKPTGDIDGAGVGASDALKALQFAVGMATPTADELKAGDIGPLFKGAANPDGKIDITDAILILRKSVDPNFSW